MRLDEYRLTEYYHQYITIEADDATELLRDSIDVGEDDCFALCSSYIGKEGMLEFNVLSIGPSWETCLKGLDRKEMLGILPIHTVFDKEARLVEPDFAMIEKNAPFIAQKDEGLDEDFLNTRLDPRLDHLRDLFYPDIVLAGISHDGNLIEYDFCITGVNGPFLTGTLDQEPEEDIGIYLDDPIWALPYVYNDELHLYAMFAGSNLSENDINTRDRIISDLSAYGISFSGFTLRN